MLLSGLLAYFLPATAAYTLLVLWFESNWSLEARKPLQTLEKLGVKKVKILPY